MMSHVHSQADPHLTLGFCAFTSACLNSMQNLSYKQKHTDRQTDRQTDSCSALCDTIHIGMAYQLACK